MLGPAVTHRSKIDAAAHDAVLALGWQPEEGELVWRRSKDRWVKDSVVFVDDQLASDGLPWVEINAGWVMMSDLRPRLAGDAADE